LLYPSVTKFHVIHDFAPVAHPMRVMIKYI
jgi:hypothetical protein